LSNCGNAFREWWLAQIFKFYLTSGTNTDVNQSRRNSSFTLVLSELHIEQVNEKLLPAL